MDKAPILVGRQRGLLGVLAAVFLALSLSGCMTVAQSAPRSAALSASATEWTVVTGDPMQPGDQPVRWASGGSRIAVTTAGSTGCPSPPVKLTVVNPTTILITVDQQGLGKSCLANLVMTTYEIATPSGLDTSTPITARLSNWAHPMTLPAL